MGRKTFSFINFGFFVFLTMLIIFHQKLQLPDWLTYGGRMHPLLVHLPIGMFIMTGIIYVFKHKFEHRTIEDLLRLGIDLSLLTSLLSSIGGLFLSLENADNLDTIDNHKYAAYGFTTLLMILSYTFGNKSRWNDVLMGIATIVLMVTGHLGGNITHGVNYLFPQKEAIKTADTIQSDNPNVFLTVIQSILDQKCVSCHKPEKIKGGLLLTDSIGFKKGGENGPIYIANNVAESRIAQFLRLPIGDENHMPPDGKVQLTSQEIRIIEHWIAKGASFSKTMKDYPETDSLAIICKSKLEKPKAAEKIYTFAKASPKTIQSLQSSFVSIKPLSANSPALDVAFFVKSAFKSEKLSELSSIKEQIIKLSMINMPLSTNDIDQITKLGNIEELILNGTPITNQDFGKLAALKNLTSLSVANTSLDRQIESHFSKFTNLKELFVSNTKVTYDIVDQWRKKYPNIRFNILKPSEELPKLPAPQTLNDSTILKVNAKIALKSLIKESIIKYTIDGTIPDSTNGIVYNGPINVSRDVHIKAVTLKDKWLSSDVAEFHYFVAGLKPDDVKILTKNNVKYPGQGSVTLINVKKADVTDNTDRNWIGFKEEPFIGTFRFDKKPAIKTLSVCYSYNIGSYIFPPTDIKLYGSNDNRSFKLIQSKSLPRHQREMPQTPFNAVATLDFETVNYPFYKLEVKNLPKIPDWHPGKGENAWLFLDEIFFYE
jgi:uncharacterized membrane protein